MKKYYHSKLDFIDDINIKSLSIMFLNTQDTNIKLNEASQIATG